MVRQNLRCEEVKEENTLYLIRGDIIFIPLPEVNYEHNRRFGEGKQGVLPYLSATTPIHARCTLFSHQK